MSPIYESRFSVTFFFLICVSDFILDISKMSKTYIWGLDLMLKKDNLLEPVGQKNPRKKNNSLHDFFLSLLNTAKNVQNGW